MQAASLLRILDTVVDAIVVSDAHDRIVYMNAAAQTLTGCTLDEAKGLDARQLLELAAADSGPASIPTPHGDPSGAPPVAARTTVTLVRSDGAHVPVDVTSFPLEVVHGEPPGTVMILSDLRLRAADPAVAKATLRELLHHSRIETLGRATGGMIHDFNNLLTIVAGDVDLLRADPDIDRARSELLDEMVDVIERAATLTHQLLRNDPDTPGESGADVIDVISRMKDLLGRITGDRVRISMDLRNAPLPARIGVSQLEQVVINLVANAADAMPNGGEISLRAGSGTGDAARGSAEDVVWFSVVDSGHGMTPEVASRAFDPLFTTKGPRNSGIGLTTVRAVIATAGGHVDVASREGHGTTVTVRLPRAAPTSAEPPEELPLAPYGGVETVLIVEDASVLRRSLARGLRALGYRVIEAAGGPEAIGLAASYQAPIDVVVADLHMYGMNGTDVVEAIRTRRPAMRAVYMSGLPPESLERHGQTSAPFLAKPFTPGQLASAIRTALAQPA